MRRILLLPVTLLLAASAYPQKNYKRQHYQMLDQARLLYGTDDHEQAAKLYKRLLSVDTAFSGVSYEYGICLKNIPGMKDHGIPYFERAVRHDHSEAYLELGLARHRQMRFNEAIELFERYKRLHQREVKDAVVDRHIAIARNARELVGSVVDVKIRNMGPMINSTAHDHCPLVTADGGTMYFTSRRQHGRNAMKDVTGQYFEDIYVAHQGEMGWEKARNAGAILNTSNHDATVGLAPDGSSMIIYRTGKDLVTGDLYEARMHAREWQAPKLMTERINSKYHEPSASIAPGGEEIYFASDRPGGYGGRDLYRIRRLPNGTWSMPLNLGPHVNTPYDEDAPFMHSDGTTLFFSSNGHNTMGGYDIFKAVLLDADMNGWSRPENLGYPLNTVNDDIYFSLSADGQTGYFSSERPGGMGMQDIYQITFPGSQLEHVYVRGVVADAGEEPVKARIILMDALDEEILGVYNTNDATGRFLMILSQGQPYLVNVEAPGFIPQRLEVIGRVQDKENREMGLDILMVPHPDRERMTQNE